MPQVRPRRAFYGEERAIRIFREEDAFAVLLLSRAIHSTAYETTGENAMGDGGVAATGGGGGGRRGGGGADGGSEHGHAAEEYLDHLNLGRFVLLLSTQRICIVDEKGKVHLNVFLRQVACCEVRRDGILLHLFDPVVVRGARGFGKYGGPPEETLVRFIKCSNPARRAQMNDRIQRALRSLTEQQQRGGVASS